MITGKIYKNKLSQPQQPSKPQKHHQQFKTIGRVKSQPSYQNIISQYKSENIEDNFQNTNISKIKKQSECQEQKGVSSFPRYQESTRGMVENQLTQYDKKMKQHMQKIERKWCMKVRSLQLALEGKDEIIEELKQMLKQREKVIQKMQKQKANRAQKLNTSRKY